MLRGNSASRWPRTITALVVALFATVASVRLFLSEPDDPQNLAALGPDVAGHVTDQFIEEPQVVSPAPEPIAITLTTERSESLATFLEDAGLSTADAQRWAWFFEKQAATGRLGAGRSVTLLKDPETGGLRGLKYNRDDRIQISEITYGDQVMRTSQEPIRYILRPVAVFFRLGTDFGHEAIRNALPRPIVATLESAFRDKHPLTDLPRGSDIRLIYQEKVSRDGSTREVTGLEAAKISYGGKTLTAFAFRDENGEPHLYDANGGALGPQTLRFPVNFDYISSGFTERRFHPILHEYRPHQGVDLATHYGAPVKAVADGQVQTAGWCGELGRCVRIRHDGHIVSVYGHLSQISVGLAPGDIVRVGEVIGRVGSSGLSTGPHLHYGLERDGRYVNPLTASLGIHHSVSPRMRALFDRFKQDYLATLNGLPHLGVHSETPSDAASEVADPPVQGDDSPAPPHHRINVRFAPHRLPPAEPATTADLVNARASVLR
ncbi:MAG TPA: peptidoglycan DD-metalloendopeptidase family protein [Candidatus Binataceae bacterium]|nr:peptidoglycan DD-metalloendopeptidase family protein [Candidatus Binataceae bacterium]